MKKEIGILWSPGTGGNFLGSLLGNEYNNLGFNEYRSNIIGSHWPADWNKIVLEKNIQSIIIIPDMYDVKMCYILARVKQILRTGNDIFNSNLVQRYIKAIDSGKDAQYNKVKRQWQHFINCNFKQFDPNIHLMYNYKELIVECNLEGTLLKGYEEDVKLYHNQNMRLWEGAGIKTEYKYMI